MNKKKIIFYIGLAIIILPLLGVPTSWKDIISIICGVAIMLLTYSLRSSDLTEEVNNAKTYVENKKESE